MQGGVGALPQQFCGVRPLSISEQDVHNIIDMAKADAACGDLANMVRLLGLLGLRVSELAQLRLNNPGPEP